MENIYQNRKNTDLEALRAVAIVLTLVTHRSELLFWIDKELPIFEAVSFRSGVDIFFVISGYVIAVSLSDFMSGAEGFRQTCAFWIKRVFRLLPTAMLWSVAAMLLAVFANKWGRFGTLDANLNSLIAALNNTMNFYYYQQSDAKEWIGPLRVYWSLSLEGQFYAVLPVLLLVSRSRKTFVVLSGAIVAIQFCIPDRSFPSFAWFVRTDALFLGVILAQIRGSTLTAKFEPKFMGKPFAPRALFILALITCMIIVDGGHFIGLFQANLVTIFAFLLVWCAHFDRSYVLGDGVVKRILVWIGIRSYSIYVTHDLVFLTIADIWIGMTIKMISMDTNLLWFSVPAAILVIIVLSDINYRFIERPLLAKGRQIAACYLSRQTAWPSR